MIVQNIIQYNKKDYQTIVDYIRYQMPALRRSDLMLKSELAFHKWCYSNRQIFTKICPLWVEHTKDVDITLVLTFKEWLCYHTVGLIILAFS